MVDDLESVTRTQTGVLSPSAIAQSSRTTAASNYLQALNDAIVLSPSARQVLNQLSQGQTVAEAWLSQFTEPPDLIKEAVAAANQPATADQGDPNTQASMQAARHRAMGDLSWLFDAMSPPKVDTNAVAKVLAERMAADAVGVHPPLPQVVAKAERDGTIPALYVENLSVSTGAGGTTATVDHVRLTTIDPTLAQSTMTTGDHPVVLDVGGDAAKVVAKTTSGGNGGDAGTGDAQAQDTKDAKEARQRALLLIRQGGHALPEGTLLVKLDVLLPLG
ncbi:MAG: hypothetical protein ACM31D_18650 [Bacteroidota bacterium]